MKKSRTILIAVVALGALALFFRLLPEPPRETSGRPAAHVENEMAGDFAVTNVRLFDGEQFTENTDVLVENGRIQAVGRNLDVDDGTERIPGEGMTLMPGLIDSHVHVFGDALEQALHFGVTTELDMFTTPDVLGPARDRREKLGAQKVADLFSAGILATAPGGHGTQYGIDIPTLEAPEQAEAFVDARLAEGSDYIKIVYDDGSTFGADFASIDRATLNALVDAAHARDVLAVVHVSDLPSARHAIKAGADGLAHVFADQPVDGEFISLIRDSGAFVIPTLSVLESVAGTESSSRLLEDPRINRFLDPAARQQLENRFGPGRGEAFIQLAKNNVERLAEAGIPILAGTDAPNPGTAHGASLHRELVLLTESGLANSRALASATSVPARAFDLDNRGRIREGAIADLVLVGGNPATDITATRAIARIWKDGREIERRPPDKQSPDVPTAPDDAEAGDFDGLTDASEARIPAQFGFGWQVTTDAMRGGNSRASLEPVSPGAAGSAGALAVTGEVKPGFAWPWAGVIFCPATEPMEPVDFTEKSELVFHARGDGGTYTVMLFSGASAQGMPAQVQFETRADWREIRLPLERFDGADTGRLRGVAFTAGPAKGEFRFAIDQVAFR
jgi:imidazolonepropionase-like amidohydrolase